MEGKGFRTGADEWRDLEIYCWVVRIMHRFNAGVGYRCKRGNFS